MCEEKASKYRTNGSIEAAQSDMSIFFVKTRHNGLIVSRMTRAIPRKLARKSPAADVTAAVFAPFTFLRHSVHRPVLHLFARSPDAAGIDRNSVVFDNTRRAYFTKPDDVFREAPWIRALRDN